MINIYKTLIASAITLSLTACGGGGGSSSSEKSPTPTPPVNNAPTVSVESLSAEENTSVTITATASDADGDTLTYSWTQTSGDAITFTEDGASISFDAPEVSANTDYAFEVTVSDGQASQKAMAIVTVNNVERTADLWVFKNSAPFKIVIGAGTGTFVGDHVELDVNNDGLNDIVTHHAPHLSFGVAEQSIPISVYVNNGDGTFENDPTALLGNHEVPTFIVPRDIDIKDMNADGIADIVFADTGVDDERGVGGPLKMLASEGGIWVDKTNDLGWDRIAYYHSLTLGHINTDEFPDIITTDLFSSSVNPGFGVPEMDNDDKVVPLINNGLGQFTHSPGFIDLTLRSFNVPYGRNYAWVTSLLTDLNQDGCDDLLLGGTTIYHPSYIAWNKCDDTGFTDVHNSYTLPEPEDESFVQINDFVAIDLNGDEHKDLLVAYNRLDYSGKYIQALINNGDNTFDDKSNQFIASQPVNDEKWVQRIYPVDLDGDLDLDLVFHIDAAGDGAEPNLVWENDNGVFRPIADPNKIFHGSLIPIDMENDGDIDLMAISLQYTGADDQRMSFRMIENLTIQ